MYAKNIFGAHRLPVLRTSVFHQYILRILLMFLGTPVKARDDSGRPHHGALNMRLIVEYSSCLLIPLVGVYATSSLAFVRIFGLYCATSNGDELQSTGKAQRL